MIVAFIDELRAEGHAVESICRVLREQGCQIAARTYRDWARTNRPMRVRTITDAMVIDQVRDLVWKVDHEGVRRMTPEGLYGRRKMTAIVRRTAPGTSPGSVDRAMRSLGLQGIRRSKGVRTTIPAKDGKRAGDLLDRDFTAQAPNRTWVTDFTYVRTWAGFVYTAFTPRSSSTSSPRRLSPGTWHPPRPWNWSTSPCGWRCGNATVRDVPSCAGS